MFRIRIFKTRSKNALANHTIECNHTFSGIYQLEIIHNCERGQKLDLLEVLEIHIFSTKIRLTFLISKRSYLYQRLKM